MDIVARATGSRQCLNDSAFKRTSRYCPTVEQPSAFDCQLLDDLTSYPAVRSMYIEASCRIDLHEAFGGLVECFALSSPVHENESRDSKLLPGLIAGFDPCTLLLALSKFELLLRVH